MNYGLSGSSPTQQFVIMKDKVDLSKTKYVIQFIGLEGDLMDVDSKNLRLLARPKVYVEFDSLDEYRIIPPRVKNLYDTVGDLLGNYQIYFVIRESLSYFKRNMIDKKIEVIAKHTDKVEQKDLTKNWLYLTGAIYQIQQLIKSNNSNIQYKIIITSTNEDNKQKLKKFLNKEKIDFMFLNDETKNMNIELESFICDGHWNDNTHRNIAKIIKQVKLIQ